MCNPSCALWYVASQAPSFGDFIRNLKVTKGITKLHMVIYEDGYKVGNVIRPDHGRGLDALYYTFLEMPDWMMSSCIGWFSLAYIPERKLKTISKSWPLQLAVEAIYGDPGQPNLADVGVFLLCTDGTNEHFQIEDTIFLLSDEVALVGQLNPKGCQGKKPCVKCRNVMARTTVEALRADPYLFHFSTAVPENFDLNTDAQVYEQADILQNLVGQIAPQNFKKIEIAFGMRYEAAAVMFVPRVRRHIRPATGTIYDWMHSIVASGSLSHYELNGYVLRCANKYSYKT